MRRAPRLAAARFVFLSALAPLAADAQAVAPWPLPHTPHAPPAIDPSLDTPESDYTVAMPGRVALDLRAESPQSVVVIRRSSALVDTPLGSAHVVLGAGTCTTPCTVYLPPGPVSLRAGGPGLRNMEQDLTVGPQGASVHLRSASRTYYNLGTGLVAVGGTVFVAEAVAAVAAELRGDSIPTGGAAGVAVAAAVLLATGIPLMVTQQVGIDSVGPATTPRVPPFARDAYATPQRVVTVALARW